jgi:Ribonuclease G/E
MSERRLYLDRGIGEDRGVVTLDGRPERLLIARPADISAVQLGARLIARVRRLEPALGSAFLDLGGGAEAILAYRPDERPVEGQSLEIEIRSEPRRGKLATARFVGLGEGAPRLVQAAPGLAEQLQAFAKGEAVVEGRAARAAADAAQAEALETIHALPGGGDLAIEPTRALTAIDVDLGERKGADAKRVTRQANLAALAMAARLLRLKGLGGIAVIDLVGRGHDGAALLAAARLAFAPDNPGVAIGPVSRFGAMEFSIPRRTPPLHERLCRPDGALTDETLAIQLVRLLQAEAQQQPGGRFVCACAPEVARLAAPLGEQLAETIGRRFSIEARTDIPRDRLDVRPT